MCSQELYIEESALDSGQIGFAAGEEIVDQPREQREGGLGTVRGTKSFPVCNFRHLQQKPSDRHHLDRAEPYGDGDVV